MKSSGSRSLEVNVSGDYNETFPEILKDGTRDEHGNGQPSVIFEGQIKATPGQRSAPRLIGRTKQTESVSHVIRDLEGISLPRNLLSKIEVECR